MMLSIRLKRAFAAACCLAVTATTLAGCAAGSGATGFFNEGGYSSSAASYAPQATAGTADMAVEFGTDAAMNADGAMNTSLPGTLNRKIIRTVYLRLETLDYEASTEGIRAAVEEAGGYVESSSFSGTGLEGYHRGRSASMVLRVPQQKLDEFLGRVGQVATVLRRSEDTEDVTLNYVDVESRKKSLEVEQERLLALLEKADDLEGIIQLETRLSEVRYQLESLTSQLRSIDSQVEYSTVSIDLDEVVQITELQDDSLLERMSSGLQRTMRSLSEGGQDLLVWFVVNLPYLLLVALLVVVVVLAIRTSVRRSRKKRALQPPAPFTPPVAPPPPAPPQEPKQ